MKGTGLMENLKNKRIILLMLLFQSEENNFKMHFFLGCTVTTVYNCNSQKFFSKWKDQCWPKIQPKGKHSETPGKL